MLFRILNRLNVLDRLETISKSFNQTNLKNYIFSIEQMSFPQDF